MMFIELAYISINLLLMQFCDSVYIDSTRLILDPKMVVGNKWMGIMKITVKSGSNRTIASD